MDSDYLESKIRNILENARVKSCRWRVLAGFTAGVVVTSISFLVLR